MEQRCIKVDLSGKNALVTGAARGIGKAIAEALAEQGAKVVIADIEYETAKETAKQIGQAAVAVKVDITAEAAIEQMFKKAEEKLGGTIDILVNNAGSQVTLASVEQMPLEMWNKAIALNLTGGMMCCKYVIGGMKKKGWGRIINVSSISARSGGGPGGTSYASAKAGFNALTKGLAKELGSAGITVNAIAPGVIVPSVIHDKYSTRENLENIKKVTPLGRHGSPQDIAGAVLFLASGSAAYITGECIAINGGLRMD